jgi:hypothetical protein
MRQTFEHESKQCLQLVNRGNNGVGLHQMAKKSSPPMQITDQTQPQEKISKILPSSKF